MAVALIVITVYSALSQLVVASLGSTPSAPGGPAPAEPGVETTTVTGRFVEEVFYETVAIGSSSSGRP